MKNLYILLFSFLILTSWSFLVNTTIEDFFLPGSQPDISRSFDSPSFCSNCHGGYDNNAEPTYTWQGSMMSQAMRDPLFLAALAIANQDAPGSGDLCLRCHAPAGWLSGRSVPTDGSALTLNDREGVDCHFCHELVDPLSTNSQDSAIINALGTNKPPQSGNGMYVVDIVDKIKRGPYNDANATHGTIYSSFYSKSEFCATCHDVSNPAFSKVGNNYVLNDLDTKATSFNTYHIFPVERTYSEWKMSAYNTTPGGIESSVFGGNKTHVSTCQDCHMKDVTGYGCNKSSVPLRSDLPQHDFTGGNTFVPKLITDGVNIAALNAGILRARNMLKNAATLDLTVTKNELYFDANVKITNETGHKLPSGYPEGRRMWINLTAYDIIGKIIFESGAYNPTTAELNKKDTYNNDSKIYEAKLGLSSTGAESFHFALNNIVIKDNRIPPRGFTNSNFEAIQSPPIGYSYSDGDYFDETEFQLPLYTHRINVKLLYQTTSKEYIDFLKIENTTNSAGQLLFNLWESNGKSTPEIMVEKEFYTSTLAIDVYNEIFKKSLVIYPNPAKEKVNLSYSLKNPQIITIEVFNFLGKKITTIFSGYQYLEESTISWNTEHIPSGIYIIKFKTATKSYSSLIKIN